MSVGLGSRRAYAQVSAEKSSFATVRSRLSYRYNEKGWTTSVVRTVPGRAGGGWSAPSGVGRKWTGRRCAQAAIITWMADDCSANVCGRWVRSRMAAPPPNSRANAPTAGVGRVALEAIPQLIGDLLHVLVVARAPHHRAYLGDGIRLMRDHLDIDLLWTNAAGRMRRPSPRSPATQRHADRTRPVRRW